MARVLASFLKNEYTISNGEVKSLKTFYYQFDGKEYEIPAKDVWVLANAKRNNPQVIVRCTPILTHSGCMNVADNIKLDLSQLETNWIKIPSKTDNHAIVEVKYKQGSMPIIGEANNESLNPSMRCYAATMALKRAIDRFIIAYSGLYQLGIYADTELGGSFNKDTFVDDAGVDENETTSLITQIKALQQQLEWSNTELREFIADKMQISVDQVTSTTLTATDYKHLINLLKQQLPSQE